MTRHTFKIFISSLLLAAFTNAGCSFLFVDKAPPPPIWNKVQWSDCTSSNAWPAVDTTIAILSGLGTVILLTGNGSGGAVAGGLLDTVIYGASAMYGFKHVGRCRGFQASKGVVRLDSLPMMREGWDELQRDRASASSPREERRRWASMGGLSLRTSGGQ